jgi:poly-beta-hydroxyalkanoate depolymerase
MSLCRCTIDYVIHSLSGMGGDPEIKRCAWCGWTLPWLACSSFMLNIYLILYALTH